MIRKYFTKLFLILTLTTLACGLPSPASNSPTTALVQETVDAPASPSPTTAHAPDIFPVSTVSVSNLTAEQLKNAQYQLSARDDHAVVQLVDGKYDAGIDRPDNSGYISIRLLDQMASGDLNADGVDGDAAALVAENYGGSSVFISLVVFLNVDGNLVQTASTLIDDRSIIRSLTIGRSEIGLIAITHDFDDPLCCPTLYTTQIYLFSEDSLRLRHMRSSTAKNREDEHEISISAPVENDVVDGTIRLIGGITIASVENALVYRVYDKDGNELMGNSIPDPIRPFDSKISFDGIPSGTTIYLEVQEVSAVDGAILAMDSIKLHMK